MNPLLLAYLCLVAAIPPDGPEMIAPPGSGSHCPAPIIPYPYLGGGPILGMQEPVPHLGLGMPVQQGFAGMEWRLSRTISKLDECQPSINEPGASSFWFKIWTKINPFATSEDPPKTAGSDCTCFPFLRLPCVRNVPSCEGDAQTKCQAQGCDRGASPYKLLQTVVYRKPAHFPMPRYTEDGGLMPAEGVLIYEDMRVMLFEGGRYKVSFNASTPNLPVTLRIQLHLRSRNDQTNFEQAYLTLPPIVILSREETDLSLFSRDRNQGNWQGRIAHIEHEGRSDWLRHHLNSYPEAQIEIARSGVARFGSLPD